MSGLSTRSFRSPELRRAFERARKAGWRYRLAGSGHVVLQSPDGIHTATLSRTTAGDGRSVQNAVAELRRGGLNL